MLKDRIRVFNKYVTNRVLGRLANRSRGPFAFVQHVGRRSGKPYKTVIMVWPLGEGFVIALTYGPEVDWLRNLKAAEGGTLLWHKKQFRVGKPEPIDAKRAMPAFPRLARQIMRRIGAHDFVWVKTIAPAQSPSGKTAVAAPATPTMR